MTRETTRWTTQAYIILRETEGSRPTTPESYMCVEKPICKPVFLIVFSKTGTYFVVFNKIRHSSFKHAI